MKSLGENKVSMLVKDFGIPCLSDKKANLASIEPCHGQGGLEIACENVTKQGASTSVCQPCAKDAHRPGRMGGIYVG